MIARRTFGRGVMGLLAGGAALVVSGCGYFGSSYRFRMTVEIDTPDGLKTGSSVYEVLASKNLALTSEEANGSLGAFGEALVVDLPNGPVFLLLKAPQGGRQLGKAATQALDPEAAGNIDSYVAAVSRLGGWFGGAEAELPRKDWPMMVRFGDINDPKSVERVDPEAIGVTRILLETTGDDVTSGIEERLGWLGKSRERGNVVSGPTINPSLAETIRDYDFGSEYK